MRSFAILALFLIALCVVGAEEKKLDESQRLIFKQDGVDLVVTLNTGANNSPHVVVTHFTKLSDGSIKLAYTVFQNQDLIKRSKKTITVAWRLSKHKQDGATAYRVRGGRIQLKSSELKTLLKEGIRLIPKKAE